MYLHPRRGRKLPRRLAALRLQQRHTVLPQHLQRVRPTRVHQLARRLVRVHRPARTAAATAALRLRARQQRQRQPEQLLLLQRAVQVIRP